MIIMYLQILDICSIQLRFGTSFFFIGFLDVLYLEFALNFVILQVLLRQGSMHAQFDDISYLSMHTRSLTDDLVPAMVSLLRGMPNLNTLYLNSHPSLNRRKPKVSFGFCCFSLPLSHGHTKHLIPFDSSRIQSTLILVNNCSSCLIRTKKCYTQSLNYCFQSTLILVKN